MIGEQAFTRPTTQQFPQGFSLGAVALALSAWSLPLAAQQTGATRAFTLTPTFTATETYSNIQRQAGFSGSEFITQLSPGVQMSSRSGRVQGSLSYVLTASHFSKGSQPDAFQNALQANYQIEAVENWLYIDTRAAISQQAISAFGEQSLLDGPPTNANRAEVGTASVSPYVRGNLGGLAVYEARLNASVNNARKSIASDSTTTGASLSLSPPRQGALIGWNVNASHQKVDFRAGRATQSDRIGLSLSSQPLPDLQLSFNAGQESTNVDSLSRRTVDNWGGSLRWTPTERTVVGLQADRRYFGNSHSVTLEHRMRRMVLRFSDTRNATSGGDPRGVGQPVSLYDLYFLQFASQFPDPALRDLQVREFLRLIGRSPTDVAGGGQLNSAVTVQRRQDLSLAVLGVRTTINLQAFTSQSSALDIQNLAPSDGAVGQRGATSSLSYRLTPNSSVSLGGAWQRTDSTGTRGGNDLKSLSLSWTGQISRTATASVSARRSDFTSNTDPYEQTSVSASINLRF